MSSPPADITTSTGLPPSTTTTNTTPINSPTPTSNTTTASQTTSNTTTTQTTSDTTASQTTSDTTATSDTATALPTTATATTSPTSTSTSAILSTTTSSNIVVTVTSSTIVTPTSTNASVSSVATARVAKTFAENKGAVAGVSVVGGLIGVGILFALMTMCLRRRRAKRFDRDVDEAAREAAGAHAPEFDEDVYRTDATGAGYLAGVATGYSDNSHGTYNQSPMDANSGENYNMREMHNAGYENYAGTGVNRARSGSSHPDSAITSMTGGMAGFGALGGSAAYSAYGTSEHSSQPYPAFAHQYNPAQFNQNDYGQANDYSNNQDYVVSNDYEGGYAVAAAQHEPTLNRQKSNARSLLDNNFATVPAEPVPAESYASRYARSSPSNAGTSTAVHTETSTRPLSTATSTYADDPYGGYDEVDGQIMPNPHSPPVDDKLDDSGPRVLKVANE